MRQQIILRLLFAGFALTAAIFLLTARHAAAADDPGQAALNPDGDAFEINIDAQGLLWISDRVAGEIWRVDPATAAYTVYEGIPAPSDARRGEDGSVWWGDYDQGRFGRLDPETKSVTWWLAPGASGLLGSQIDGAGDFWAAAVNEPLLFRYQPAAGMLCTYTLPKSGIAAYPQIHDGSVWLGDEANGRILRLDPASDKFTAWELPDDAEPLGMSFDNKGALWYADPNNAYLARLDPGSDQLDTFDPPTGLLPQMVAVHGSNIWYSEHWDGAVGRLIPSAAGGESFSLTRSSAPATVNCADHTPEKIETVTTRSGDLSWVSMDYSLAVDDGVWQIYDLPSGAVPWGIAGDGQQVWFVDRGRQLLGRIPQDAQDALVTVTACLVEDADGNGATPGDRTPLSDWTVHLLVEEERQGDGHKTGDDGCVTWSELASAVRYGVEEELPSGWHALTPSKHDFGTADPGALLHHTFINSQNPISDAFVYLPVIISR